MGPIYKPPEQSGMENYNVLVQKWRKEGDNGYADKSAYA